MALLRHGRFGGNLLPSSASYAIALGATLAATLLVHYRIENPARDAMRRNIDVLIPVPWDAAVSAGPSAKA